MHAGVDSGRLNSRTRTRKVSHVWKALEDYGEISTRKPDLHVLTCALQI